MEKWSILNQIGNREKYILHLADNVLILGQRLGEWCGHGPVLEQDIALTNISLDLIGQARLYYQYLAAGLGHGLTEDDLAFFRDNRQFYNLLLVEQPNGDWGQTILRQFLFDSWHVHYLEALSRSADQGLADIAAKALKEVKYHCKFSSEWVVRLGDGTEESHRRMQEAIDNLWSYADEYKVVSSYEQEMIAAGIAVDPRFIQMKIEQTRSSVMQEATLTVPEHIFGHSGGKEGVHTEYLGYILAELQFMQRAYPGLEW